MKWLSEHDEALKAAFAAGLSAAEVANEIGRKFNEPLSRNAALGRAFRLGLTSKVTKADGARIRYVHPPGKPVMRTRARPKPNAKPAAQQFKCEPITGLRAADVIPLHVSLLDLEPGQCRWPYGDGPFTFCGCEQFGGSSYCEPHQALSFKGSMQGVNYDQTAAQRTAHRRVIVPAVAALAREYGSEGDAA